MGAITGCSDHPHDYIDGVAANNKISYSLEKLTFKYNPIGTFGMKCTLLMASLCGIRLFPRVSLNK